MIIQIKKRTLYSFLILAIILVAGFFLVRGNDNALNNTNNPRTLGGDFQKVIIGVKNYNYYPNTITVKVNQPVRIYLDSSVGGCFRDFTIPAFNVRKYLKTPSDYVEFTPTKTGTFAFACSMNMGQGKLIV